MAAIDQESESSEDEVLLGRLVALAIDWAADGRLDRANLLELIDQVSLPARLYPLALRTLADGGIAIGEVAVSNDDDDADDEIGSAVDGFGEFLRRTRHVVLTQSQEYELGKVIDAGRMAQDVLRNNSSRLDASASAIFRRQARRGREAESTLALHNVRLVIHIANKLRPMCSPGLDFEDLIQEGYLGLAHAIGKWDHTRGLKFSTYATWWIRQSMDRAIADKGTVIRLPVHARDELRRILKEEASVFNAGIRPTTTAIARRVGLPAPKVRFLLSWRNRLDSLDRLLGVGEWTVGDAVSDPEAIDVQEHAERVVLQDQVRALVNQLPRREADVIRSRFGFNDEGVQTLEQVGERLGVTRERIRQIEAKALGILERPARPLQQYLT